MKLKSGRLDVKPKILLFLIYTAISAAAAWLVYDSFYAMPAFMPFFILFVKAVEKEADTKYREQLTDGFIRTLVNISTSLSAGESPENAFISSSYEAEKLYGKRAPIVMELEEINLKVASGERLTDAVNDFAAKVRIPEIHDFATVFAAAKENGSDFPAVISTCVAIMESKRRTEQEAGILIRARQYEQRLMFIVWPGILLYLRLSSGSFIGVLYHNPLGVAVMTAGLAVFVLAVCIGERSGDLKA